MMGNPPGLALLFENLSKLEHSVVFGHPPATFQFIRIVLPNLFYMEGGDLILTNKANSIAIRGRWFKLYAQNDGVALIALGSSEHLCGWHQEKVDNPGNVLRVCRSAEVMCKKNT